MTAAPPFVCPRCKGPLRSEAEAYRCAGCGDRFPVVLGIPDFRLFPDPYISIEDDYEKGRALAAASEGVDLAGLVARYWAITPGVPPALASRYASAALHAPARAAATWKAVLAERGPRRRARLLEIGCGTGGFLAAVGPEFEHAVGVDIAFRWLIVARKRLEEAGVGHVSLACACAEHLPYPDGLFDLVAGEDVLDHVREPWAALREIARTLERDGGIVFLTTPNRFSLGPDPHVWVWGVGFLPPRLRDRYVRWRRGVAYGPIRPVSYLELRHLLREAALEPVEVLLPGLDDAAIGPIPRWQRGLVRLYEAARRLRWLRGALLLVGPGFQVLGRRIAGPGSLLGDRRPPGRRR